MSKILEIGTKVFVFDTEKQEPALLEDMICGSFINIESGDLYYYTTKYKQPHYAVAETLEEGKERLQKFLDFRAFVREAQEKVNAKRAELMGELNFKEVVKSFYDELAAEQPSIKQEPANE